MTGKEMILYIQRHKLEEKELFDLKGVPKGLLNTIELAHKLDVSESTVRVWIQRGKLVPVARISGRNYFYPETVAPDGVRRGRTQKV